MHHARRRHKSHQPKPKPWPRVLPRDPTDSHIHIPPEYVVSVEEYFAQGMAEYARELTAEAPTPRPVPTDPRWWLLGDVLERQLCCQELTTRAVQTDWKWLQMAVRWRHARTIETTVPRKTVSAGLIVIPQTASTAIVSKKRGTRSSVTRDLSVKEAASSKKSLKPEDAVPGKRSLKPVVTHRPRRRSARKSHDFPSKASTVASDQPPSRIATRKSALPPILVTTAPTDDKCVDTCDLGFDPYDPTMKYTPRMTLNPMISEAASQNINRWKFKTRMRLATEGQKAKSEILKIEEEKEPVVAAVLAVEEPKAGKASFSSQGRKTVEIVPESGEAISLERGSAGTASTSDGERQSKYSI